MAKKKGDVFARVTARADKQPLVLREHCGQRQRTQRRKICAKCKVGLVSGNACLMCGASSGSKAAVTTTSAKRPSGKVPYRCQVCGEHVQRDGSCGCTRAVAKAAKKKPAKKAAAKKKTTKKK